MIVFEKGELVRITFEGRTVNGEILLASGNGLSLALSFDAMLGNGAGAYVNGMMPVLWNKDLNQFEDLIMCKPVKIERLEESDELRRSLEES